MPLSLKELQQQFAAAIYEKNDPLITEAISGKGISKEARLQIYRNNLFITLTQTLQNLYPALQKLVGDEFFTYTAHQYIEKHPSISGNLDSYGENFADFIEGSNAAKDYHYLPDMARLEFARHLAYMAADAESMDVNALTQVEPEQYESLSFILQPSAFLLTSAHPIDQLWELTQADTSHPSDIELNTRGADILVIRPELRVEQYLLKEGEYAFLQTLQNGHPLSEAYEATNLEDFDAGAAIQKFVLNKTLTAFSL